MLVSGQRIWDANEHAIAQQPKQSGDIGDLPLVTDLPRSDTKAFSRQPRDVSWGITKDQLRYPATTEPTRQR